MEKFIDAVIAKVRKTFVYQDKYKDMVTSTPEVNLYYDVENHKIILRSMIFYVDDNYDTIIVYPDKIIYESESGKLKTLMEYGSFEDFLNI